MKVNPSRALLWLGFLGLVASGIGLYLCLPKSLDEFPHPLAGSFRQLHGAFAMLGLGLLGYLWSDHIGKKLRHWRRHPDGLIHLGLWLALVLSGYLLYYPPACLEGLVPLSALHWYLGLGLVALFPIHASRLAWQRYRARQQRLARSVS
ncbi:hypothetical protein PVT67_12860 [Gallaecimonas kandeliae]|uniref:hypothetical protein n=1 Tax=Gallaecimonas kandeliae TaxID=3029055 RepID=UPI0026480320|nr:hypothetical protein [Gallaecimonas kandeliae]WKE64554.1 hypothetical protein PVT67_12860 [Gallaecimonas kandeliae]